MYLQKNFYLACVLQQIMTLFYKDGSTNNSISYRMRFKASVIRMQVHYRVDNMIKWLINDESPGRNPIARSASKGLLRTPSICKRVSSYKRSVNALAARLARAQR